MERRRAFKGYKMNSKKKGEIGERISIGELAKFGIDVAIPLTDNLPFDYIIIYKSKLFKAQVKSATPREDVCEFDLSSNNWYSKTTRKYTKKDVDVFILCDFINVFMLVLKDFEDKRSFII